MPENMYDGMKNIAKVLGVAAVVLYCMECVTDSKLFLGLFGGVALIAAVLYGVAECLRHRANQKNPVSSDAARLVGRRIERYGRRKHIIKHFLSFRTIADGSWMEFEVPESEFEAHEQDEVGMLQHRTWEYIAFKRDESLRTVNQEKQNV